jgi:glucose-1-phosphate thymidylyltransferase
MKCVILAAGYATRLYPLTLDRPKPLLPVAGRCILDRILDKVRRVSGLEEVILVSNAKFYRQFVLWAAGTDYPGKITVLNDGSTDNINRLGAVADIKFAADERDVRDNCLVLAGDNLFDFELVDFADYFWKKGKDCITSHVLHSPEKLRRTGVIETDGEGKVLSFEEKPREPRTNLAVPPFYLYTRETLPLIDVFLKEGNNPDAPGNFIPWLIRRRDVYAFLFTGERYDIGNLESYEEAERIFSARTGHG